MEEGRLYWFPTVSCGHNGGVYVGEHGKLPVMETSGFLSHHCKCCCRHEPCHVNGPIVEAFSVCSPHKHQLLPMSPSVKKAYKKGDRILACWIHSYIRCATGSIVHARDDGTFFILLDNGNCHDMETRCMWPENVVERRANCKRAVICWLLVSSTRGLHKDMRKLIARYVWNARDDDEWSSHKHSRQRRKAHKKVKSYAE